MTEPDPLIASMFRAVEASPDDLPLRLHLAELLLARGDTDGAVSQAAAVLQRDPGSADARALMNRAIGGAGTPPPAAAETRRGDDGARRPERFDWKQAEEDVGEVVPPAFVSDGTGPEAVREGGEEPEPVVDAELSAVRLADVGGMEEAKARLEAAFLAPMRNPELGNLYRKSLRGGLLMYGPPGCGKTFLARAVAGELGARFVSVSLADILDMWIGNSEKNIQSIFRTARQSSPCVLFLDEIDALGLKRSKLISSGMRGTINQLLVELDSADSGNDGVFVLAATNHPWDVDSALLRPGRLDRSVLVLPPDPPARAAIIRYHLRDRPIAGIDLDVLVRRTDGFSGADLAHMCESAAELAILEASRTGEVKMIGMPDFDAALGQIRPSTGPWYEAARNVVLFGGDAERYAELRAYMKRRKLL